MGQHRIPTRAELEAGYFAEVPTGDPKCELCFHIDRLNSYWNYLSALEIKTSSPMPVSSLAENTLFLCAEICRDAIEAALEGCAITSHFTDVWLGFSRAHSRIRDLSLSRHPTRAAPLHLMYIASSAVCVLAGCREEYEFEAAWLPISRRYVATARFALQDEAELAREMSAALQAFAMQ